MGLGRRASHFTVLSKTSHSFLKYSTCTINQSPFRDTKDVRATLLKVTENRWDAVQTKIDSLAKKVSALRMKLGALPVATASPPTTAARGNKNLVITASPRRPPHSVLACIQALVKAGHSVWAKTHAHSSLPATAAGNPAPSLDFLSRNEQLARSDCDYTVSLIWRADARAAALRVGGGAASVVVEGEDNILRYFSRITASSDPGLLPYEAALSSSKSAMVDAKMDAIAKSGQEKVELEGEWVCGDFFSIADLFLYSALAGNRAASQMPKKWQKAMAKAHDSH